MREAVLNKTGALKSRNLVAELFFSDLESSVKSFTPGEWAIFYNPKKDEAFAGFINPSTQENHPCAYLLKRVDRKTGVEPEVLLEKLLQTAITKRSVISDYGMDGRMVYGLSDGLPGLVVDSFVNCALVQINTAGLDKYREFIKEKLFNLLNREIVFLDNPSYRAAENLPIFNERVSVKELEIMENGLSFKAANDHWQKTGFYYDHRENRKKLAGYLSRLNANFPSKALDLFCYLGAWGMTLAKAGVPNVDFIDQGNFEEDLKRNWELNALSGKLRFQRKDVFKALKELNLEDAKYDLIVSDPPAFCKSPKGLKKASEGYLRLHRACFKLLSDKSFFAACSCTKYMDMEAFIQNVNLAAQQERKKVTMLDIGSQGFDHPCAGFKDKSNYLKYTLFYVENL